MMTFATNPPQKMLAALPALATALLLATLLIACDSHRGYRCLLSSEEAVPLHQSVTLDGRVVGTVAAIRQDGSSRYAIVCITDRAAQSAMRVGVEREQRGADVRLSSASVKPDAAPLDPSTAIIPTRAPLDHAARKTLDGAQELLWRIRGGFVDHPLLGVAVGVVALILLVSLLCRCLRRACTVLLVIALLAAAASALATPVKRDQVEAEIRRVEGLVARAEEFAAEARRLTKAGLIPSAQATGIRAILCCDRATDFEATCLGNIDRISTWSASADTKAAFRNRYGDARQRRARVEDAIAEVASASANSEPRLIPIYLTQRDLIKSRLHGGKTDEDQLLKDLFALARFPVALIQQKLITVDNLSGVRLEGAGIRLPDGQLFSLTTTTTNAASAQAVRANEAAANLARLQQQVANELADLRRARERTNPPVTIIVTNEVRTIVEKPVPAPAPPPIVQVVTNVQRIFVDRPVTNVQIQRVFVTNTPPAVASGEQNPLPTPKPNATLTLAPPITLAPTSQGASFTDMNQTRRESTTPLSNPALMTPRQAPATATAPPRRQAFSVLPATNTVWASPPKTERGPSPTPPGVEPVTLVNTTRASSETIARVKSTRAAKTNALADENRATGRGQSTALGRSAPSASWMRRNQVFAAMLTIGAIFTVAALFFATHVRRDEQWVVRLLVDGEQREFDLEARRDAVFLDTDIFCAEKNCPQACPRIEVKRTRTILYSPKGEPPGRGDICVNGVPAKKPCVLQPGDVISLARDKQPDQCMKFLGHAEAVPAVNEVEIPYAPTHSTP